MKEFTEHVEFQREMNALLQIRAHGGHPNICMLRENFDEEDDYLLVLDLVMGKEMFDHLIEHGAYSEADASRLVRQVASALDFIHGIGVVHADLKVCYYLVNCQSYSVILDFANVLVLHLVLHSRKTLCYDPQEAMHSSKSSTLDAQRFFRVQKKKMILKSFSVCLHELCHTMKAQQQLTVHLKPLVMKLFHCILLLICGLLEVSKTFIFDRVSGLLNLTFNCL